MRGIRRTIGAKPDQKAAATADRLTDMLACIPADTLAGKRDRALLALGFAGAFRRSELVALTIADLIEVEGGFRVTIHHSKTDQERQGQEIAIPTGGKLRPVEAVQAWLDAAGITDGPVFRSVAKPGAARGPDGSQRGKHRQGVCRAGRARCGHVQRAQPARRLSDHRGRAWRIGVQDDGGQPP
jgi:integrase